jgi:uncharacterized phiE125 gp8 family phage protein
MSSLTLITPPTAEPVSLAEAKAQCRVTAADEDGLLAGFLVAARSHCEDFTHRVFSTQSWLLTIDGGWPNVFNQCTVMRHTRIVLPNPPAQSVASITYVDTNGATQTLDPGQYQFSKGDMHGYIDQAFGVSWPQVRNQPDAIAVQFTAGYGLNPSRLPEPIRQAILMLTAHFFDNREPVVGIATRAVPSEMPFAVSALLSRYVTEGWV